MRNPEDLPPVDQIRLRIRDRLRFVFQGRAYKRRFAARAAQRGIVFSSAPPPRRFLVTAMGVATLSLIGWLGGQLHEIRTRTRAPAVGSPEWQPRSGQRNVRRQAAQPPPQTSLLADERAIHGRSGPVRARDDLKRARPASRDVGEQLKHPRGPLESLRPGIAKSIDRERKLPAADLDIRELMGARSLHIVDASGADGQGKTQRPFGRVFYTKGKSLVFYAFHLKGGPTFQAWGQREARDESARSLGLFYVDDRKQNRWVLKFEDSKVLSEINAVFVTVEPPGGSVTPNRQKMLYAYLDATPNPL